MATLSHASLILEAGFEGFICWSVGLQFPSAIGTT